MNKNYENTEIARNNKGLNESELCTKIQNLTSNIKNQYNNDKISNNITNSTYIEKRREIVFSNANKNTSNSGIRYDTDSFSSISQDSDWDEVAHSNPTIRHVNANNENSDVPFIKNNFYDNKIPKNEPSALISQGTLCKFKALEQLIFSTDRTLRNSKGNEILKSRLSMLIREFQEVKIKIELGTRNKLMDYEILDLMKTLKLLFENFYSIQHDILDNEAKNLQIHQQNPSIRDFNDYRLKSPSEKDIQGEKYFISNITCKSDEYLSSNRPEEQYQTNSTSIYDINNFNINQVNEKLRNSILPENYPEPLRRSVDNLSMINAIKFKQRYFPQSVNLNKEFEGKINSLSTSKESYLNLHQFEPTKSSNSFKLNTRYNNLRSPKRIEEFDDFVQDSKENTFDTHYTQFSDKKASNNQNFLNKPFNYSKNSFIPNKSSKLPILKKENLNENKYVKRGKISYISQTVANKVLNNLQQIGYFTSSRAQVPLTNHSRSKSDGILKSLRSKDKVKRPISPSPKEEDRLYKSCVTSLYLTKLGSVRYSNISKNDFRRRGRCNSSNSRIFSLETLLAKNKYKFVNENKSANLKNHLNKEKYIFHNSNSLNSIFIDKGDKKELRKKDTELDLTMLLSLANNSIKIVHQIILFPSTTLEMSSSENLTKNPRIVHIENICSCKIIILNRKECFKRKVKPAKGLKVIEIHYDLRKGKALGCVNMLRQFAGSQTQNMKIYRSSVLLPGGYLKEMTSSSITELLNLSFQVNEKKKDFSPRN